MVDREGTAQPLLSEEQSYEDTRLSPDGKRLAVEINMPGGDDVVWVYDLERGTMTRLTFSSGGSFNPVWTSDGHQLIYGSAGEGGIPNLFRKRADGAGEAEQLTMQDNVALPFSSSPDGKFVAFCAQSSETGFDIWILPLDDKGITAFNHFPDYDIDEAAIEIGTVAMANVLVSYLQTHAAVPESSRDAR